MSDPHFRDALFFTVGFIAGMAFLGAAIMLGLWLQDLLEIDEDWPCDRPRAPQPPPVPPLPPIPARWMSSIAFDAKGDPAPPAEHPGTAPS